MPSADNDDSELLQRIAAGDEWAFREVVRRHITPVHYMARRLLRQPEDGEEVVQEAFRRLWQTAERLEAHTKLRPWLYTVVRHLAIDRLRKRRETLSEEVDDVPSSTRPSLLLSEKRDAEAVQEALKALAPRQREAITMVYYDGLTGAETAEALGVGIEAVESLLSRARHRLRALLSPIRLETDLFPLNTSETSDGSKG